jgi:hypothetical protein
VLGAAGKTKTTQKNILDWLELDDGDSRWKEIATVFLFIIISMKDIIKFSTCWFSNFFL